MDEINTILNDKNFQEIYLKIKEKYERYFAQYDWYLQLKPFLKEYFWDYNGNKSERSKEWLNERMAFAYLVSTLLEKGKIALGKSGENLDSERKQVDKIIIHHTSTPPDTPLSYIESLILLRIYAKDYSNVDKSNFGLPIWSGHFYKGKQTFHAYHYLIKDNGEIIHMLDDKYIGWQSGDWETNTRSIGIAFIDQLNHKAPTELAINSAKKIIKSYPKVEIFGHKEVNKSTTCPGELFLNDWKSKLI